MNEERTGKCLGQVEHIRGYLGHRYSIMANQAMVAIVKQFRCYLLENVYTFIVSSPVDYAGTINICP